MSLLYYGNRKQCEPRITILKDSFIQDISVEDNRSRHPGGLEDLDVRLQDIITGWVNGHGTREPGDGRRGLHEAI